MALIQVPTMPVRGEFDTCIISPPSLHVWRYNDPMILSQKMRQRMYEVWYGEPAGDDNPLALPLP